MKEPRWLTLHDVDAFHSKQIQEHGGLQGLRDKNLLQSALGRPQQLLAYSDKTDIFELAAAYAYGIIKNHPFLDGNKRTGIITAAIFLMMNGYNIIASEEDLYLNTISLANGTQTESQFAKWLQENSAMQIQL
ncbi:MAG: type II toxin-antitoxin system death-on-curing family toxin [Gammaproteobacteria bacterium]|nr:type II toxin-antitoxin system death-on-curing family toxin [Gammaproteobacteria bacterium]